MLNNKQCEAFLAVAETGSFDTAGLKLSITPSAVTIRIQSLEKSLGHLLFIRGKPCVLTQAGRKLLEYLKHSKRLEQDLIYDLTGQTENDHYKISVAVNADSLATWFLPFFKNFLIQERLLFELHLDDQTHTHQLLETGTVNACISTSHTPMKGCIAQYIGTMRYIMVCTPSFKKKWFSKDISRETLRNVPAIIFNQKDQIHFDLLLEYYGLSQGMYPFHLIPSSESFLEAIHLGLGYGLVPELQLKMDLRYSNKKFIQPLPEFYIDVPLYWHYWQQQSEPLQKLTQYLLTHIHHYL